MEYELKYSLGLSLFVVALTLLDFIIFFHISNKSAVDCTGDELGCLLPGGIFRLKCLLILMELVQPLAKQIDSLR